MAIFIPEHKTLFIHIPKTAGTSISNWINNNFISKEIQSKHTQISKISLENFSFACVRNPYDRLISWYNFRLAKAYRDNNIPGNREFMLYCQENDGFETFVNDSNKTPGLLNSIWWTQKSFIDHNTVILKFENLDEDFIKIQNKLDCHQPLGKFNVSKPTEIRYTQKSRKIVQEFFYEDFKHFGYEI